MGKFYTLNIPTWINGINTTIDVGDDIKHMVFDNGLPRNRLYDIIANSNLDNVVLQVITDDFVECKRKLEAQFNSRLGIYEVHDITSATNVIKEMVSKIEKRYKLFNDINVKDIEAYNSCYGKSAQMKPVIICWMGADKFLSRVSKEESLNLFSEILKKGRTTGVSLILHSDDFYGIKRAASKDLYYNLASIGVATANEYPKEIDITVYDRVYNMSIRPRIM